MRDLLVTRNIDNLTQPERLMAALTQHGADCQLSIMQMTAQITRHMKKIENEHSLTQKL